MFAPGAARGAGQGFGESAGDAVDGDQLLLDAHAALDHLDSLGYARQVLHGQSLGSAIALRVAPLRPRVVTLVLTGALTGAGTGDSPYPFLREDRRPPGTAVRTCTCRSRAHRCAPTWW